MDERNEPNNHEGGSSVDMSHSVLEWNFETGRHTEPDVRQELRNMIITAIDNGLQPQHRTKLETILE